MDQFLKGPTHLEKSHSRRRVPILASPILEPKRMRTFRMLFNPQSDGLGPREWVISIVGFR
jgi:hypothetical protein